MGYRLVCCIAVSATERNISPPPFFFVAVNTSTELSPSKYKLEASSHMKRKPKKIYTESSHRRVHKIGPEKDPRASIDVTPPFSRQHHRHHLFVYRLSRTIKFQYKTFLFFLSCAG